MEERSWAELWPGYLFHVWSMEVILFFDFFSFVFSASSKEMIEERSAGWWHGAATRLICVGSKEKPKSWVEMRKRRSAMSSFMR